MAKSIINIRPAKESDAERITDVVNKAYRTKHEKAWTSEADLVEGLRISQEETLEIIRDPSHGIILVAVLESTDTIIGTIQIERTEVETEGMLGLFSVLGDYQSQGIGKQLIQAGLEQLRYWKCTKAVVWVIETRQEILKWYINKLGFYNTGEKHPFVLPDLAKGKFEFLVLKKDLEKI